MAYKISFEGELFDSLFDLEKKEQKKVRAIIKDIERNGSESGYAHCEPLKEDFSGCFSKSVDKKNRVVFRIVDDRAEIIAVNTHYGDK